MASPLVGIQYVSVSIISKQNRKHKGKKSLKSWIISCLHLWMSTACVRQTPHVQIQCREVWCLVIIHIKMEHTVFEDYLHQLNDEYNLLLSECKMQLVDDSKQLNMFTCITLVCQMTQRNWGLHSCCFQQNHFTSILKTKQTDAGQFCTSQSDSVSVSNTDSHV